MDCNLLGEIEHTIYLMCSLVAVATAVRARATPTPGALGSKLFLDSYLETVQRDFVSCGMLFLEPPPLVLLDVIGIPEHFTGGRVSPIDEPHGVSVGTRMLMLVRHNLEEKLDGCGSLAVRELAGDNWGLCL